PNGRRPIFEDRDSLPLESQLNRIFCGIYRQVVRAWREERKHQAFQRKHEEEARRKAEAARLQAESEQALAAVRSRRRQLTAEAVRWTLAARIRDYVAHVRTAATERLDVSSTLTDWMDWALRVAADLDPTERRLAEAGCNVP